MPDFLNRTTLTFVRSGNAPLFTDPPWLEVVPGSPNRAVIDTVPHQYWVLEGDTLREMTQPEKDAADAAATQAGRDAAVAQIDQVEDLLRAFMLAVLDELNAHADKLNEITSAVDGAANLSQFGANMQRIADYPQRSVANLRAAIRNRLGS